MTPPRPPQALRLPVAAGFLLSLLGAALLSHVGWRYRLDRVACAAWPSLSQNLGAAALFVVAVALLGAGWLWLLRRCQSAAPPPVWQILLAALAVYFVAALGPPALSEDPLFYAAIGRVQAEYAASPAQPLCQILPSDDALLLRLIPHWRCGRSPYQPGFDRVAWLIASAARGDLLGILRGFQIVAAVCLLLAGGLIALALRGSGMAPSYGAALVVLNPLAVIEGPASAHNDAWLALATSGFALAWQRRSGMGLLLSLGAGFMVKSSSLLLVFLLAGALLLRRLAPRLNGSRARRCLRLGLPLFVAVLLLAAGTWLYVARPEALFGPRHLRWEHCTRSLECLPRSLLRAILHQPQAAFAVAVGFRLLSLGWLLYAAWRASREPGGPLPWLGAGLLIYFLYLHPWSQSWYLLSLLPLAPWLHPSLHAALRAVSISAAAYYALVLIGNCLVDDLAVASFDLAEALIVLLPPSLYLLRKPVPRLA